MRTAATLWPVALGAQLLFVGCGDKSPAALAGSSDAEEAAQDATVERPRTVGELVSRAERRPPVYFIGLDGGDWELLDRLMAAGAMPHLATLVREGRRGTLLTEHPPLSPLVWTTMMTGVSPLEHKILDFSRFRPGDGEREPASGDDRARPAIWNMATWSGKRVAVFGLWATFPAEAVDGAMVSDRLFGFLNIEDKPPDRAVYPPQRQQWATAALLRARDESDLDDLRRFLPGLTAEELARHSESEHPYDHPVSALRRILVETRLYDALFRSYVDAEKPDLAILYIQGTDSIGHLFAPFGPPRQATVSLAEFERYKEVPAAYFRWVDSLLGRYHEMAQRDGAVLLLASDHGFYWQEGRPTQLSSFDVATAAKWHRKEGIYSLWGPVSWADGRESGTTAGVRQIASTLLALLGLPPGTGMEPAPLPPIASWPASVPRFDYSRVFDELRARRRAADVGVQAPAASEELAKLRALGYLDASELERAPPAAIASGSTRTAASFNNEALIHGSEGRKSAARAAYEGALELNPRLASALWNLSDLLYQNADYDRSDQLLLRAVENDLPEVEKYLIGRAIGYQRDGRPERSLALLDRAVELAPAEPEFWLFLGRYRIEARDCRGAVVALERAVQLEPARPAFHASVGVAHLCLGNNDLATSAFRRSLALDPNQPQVRQFLARLGRARQ